MRAAYHAAITMANAAARLAPAGDGKLTRSLRARVGLLERVRARSALVRDPRRPLVWFHAPSVGEGLQARPVALALRAAHPSWQQAYTYFSPSAERFASTIGADISDYLPFDSAASADAMLDAIQPSALVFAKLDVWPMLVERAVARGIPVVMISATLAERSGRNGWWSRQLLHDAYASLRAVGAIDATNAERLQQLGVQSTALQITGDTRFDQVAARAAALDRLLPLISRLQSTRPTLVAGSTWPADESVLLDAWARIAQRRHVGEVAPRLLIAPHEPTAAHCEPLLTWADSAGLRIQRLSEIDALSDREQSNAQGPADVVLIDRVGVLGDLYGLANVAFVGGGFHSAGLHSVIEPAAFGVPVLFGPRFDMSREAGLLIAAGGGHAVSDSASLFDRLSTWLADVPARKSAGRAARTAVERELGATERSVKLIESVLTTDSRHS